ncbi:EthD domain-containing protein [Sphingomonas sp. PAMC 26621]|uniref:EthD domain-containing protein n=1 Tax=Sphingomonas sp. PAMC 26621 TaxID=1112213 RepID=UPI00028A0DDF|nr:EthD domain-containing protein [Sphingomonas sp. PAMC 26621]
MPKISIDQDYAARDASIAINSYTTVLRRPRVPHELFATYWRDVHGPLCSRIPGLAWYVQNHFDRAQDAHLWPNVEGITPFPDYELDGGVEIGFASSEDQAVFNEASHILFADEQNMFEGTVAYALPKGSRTLVDRIPDATPNADDGFDRIHVHLGAAGDDMDAFGAFLTGFAETLAAEPAVLKVRLHLPERYDNANPAPPAPNVNHLVPPERSAIGILELAFETPLTRRAFLESDAFAAAAQGLRQHVRHATAFAVSGVYTYVRDKTLTLAGLRGSRPAQLIERLGANNQAADDVRQLIHTGKM